MSHDDAFAAFQARREAERAAAVKVTWRKVSPMTGGGWSALGPNGALGFVNPKRPSGFEYGLRDGKDKPVAGVALTLARAKAAVEQMFVESLALRDETCIVHAVNGQSTHFTGGTKMQTKITALTALQVRAINEVLPGVETTASTAVFNQSAADALADVQAAMAELPSTGHPRQSLHAVVRKLQAQAAKEPAVLTPAAAVERMANDPTDLDAVRQLTARAQELTTTAAQPAGKEATVATKTPSKPKAETTEATEGVTAEQFAATLEGVEAVRAAKAPTARLRANGRTLAYADDRKGGFNLNLATKEIEAAPAKVKGLVEIKGSRATLRVTTKNAKQAATLVTWLAKQAA